MTGRHAHPLRVVLPDGAVAPGDPFDAVCALLENGFEVRRGEDAAGDDRPTLRLDPAAVAGPGDAPDPAGLDPDRVVALAREAADRAATRALAAWKPWFPVIDHDRCTNCMQCLTFCLFDVYGVDDRKRITVRNEAHCKTDCPACSRVCPEVAILFPKYGKGPINGAEVRNEDLEREGMKVDLSAMLGGDLYGALRDRTASARKRFSTERDESRALLERKRCLAKLQREFDIPDEILMTLPTAEDIEARAARARAKLEKRRAESRTVRDAAPPPSPDDWGI